jgi:hypothetical protein
MLIDSQKYGAEQAALLPNKALQSDARYARAAELMRWADTEHSRIQNEPQGSERENERDKQETPWPRTR